MHLTPNNVPSPFDGAENQHPIPPATARLLRSNWRWWVMWCKERSLPVEPPFAADQVKAAITTRVERGQKRATVSAFIHAINAASRIAGHPSPCQTAEFQSWLSTLRRGALPAAQRQAVGLNIEDVDAILSTLDPSSPPDLRDGALIAIAYDGFLRSDELSRANWSDLDTTSRPAGTLTIRKSKTDQQGQGKKAYVSERTLDWLDRWRKWNPGPGPIFVSLRGRSRQQRLTTRSIRRIFAELGNRIGKQGLSGHSARVGATQDATEANLSVNAIMVAARWSSPKMPARYGEAANAHRLGDERMSAVRRAKRARRQK